MYLKTLSTYRVERDQQPHHLYIDFSKDSLFGVSYKSRINIYVDLPYPVHMPFKFNHEEVEDSIKGLLNHKNERQKELFRLRSRFKFSSRSIGELKLPKSKAHYAVMPEGLLDFYKSRNNAEDFKADYNLYYTGGVLEYLQMGQKNYLIRPIFNGSLTALNLRDSEDQITIPYVVREAVCGLKCYQISQKNAFLVIREKYLITVFNLKKIQKLDLIFNQSYETAVFDAKLNSANLNHMGIVLCNGSIQVVEVDTGKPIFNFQNDVENSPNNFQQLEFMDQEKLIVMDEFCLKIMNYCTKIVLKTINPNVIPCNSLCNFKVLHTTLFIITRHYIMKADLENVDDISYFSHTLDYAPCFADLIDKDDDIFLCLSDHFNDSKVLFTSHSLYNLPHRVPGIKTTLEEARLRNSNILLLDKLDERLSYSTAGIKFIELEEKLFLYATNCVGEIFRQEISLEKIDTGLAVQVLANFITKIPKLNPKLHVTDFVDMSHAFELLKNGNNIEATKEQNMTSRFLSKYGRVYEKQNITSQFASHFLDVWDSDEEEDVGVLENVTEVPFHDKVTEWMDSRYNMAENTIDSELDLDFLTHL